MSAEIASELRIIPVVPMDDETRAMLAYVESEKGSARIRLAREELERGEGIIISPEYFDDLNLRVDRRTRGSKSDGA